MQNKLAHHASIIVMLKFYNMERGTLVSWSIEPTSIIYSIASSQCMSSRMEWGEVRMEGKEEERTRTVIIKYDATVHL